MILVYIALAALGAIVVLGLTLVLAGTPLSDKRVLPDFAAGGVAIVGLAVVLGGLMVYALKGLALH